MLQQEHWWDNLIWVVVFLFLIPSSLVVASWNSLPGSRLYRVKLAAEDSLVALAFSKAAKSELEVSYADKRLSDATQLLTETGSADGLEYFRSQIQDAKNALAQAPDGEVKEELRVRYITALQNASRQLDQQKQLISSGNSVPSKPSAPRKAAAPAARAPAASGSRPREVVVIKEVTKVNYVTQVNQVTQVTNVTNVISQIDETQEEITEIINQVQATPDVPAVIEESPANTPSPIPATATPIPTEPPPPENTPQASFGAQGAGNSGNTENESDNRNKDNSGNEQSGTPTPEE